MTAIRNFTRLTEFKPPQQLVFAKGPTGQKLRISGDDVFSGGVGTRSNDTIFGGEDFTGSSGWSGTSLVSNRGRLVLVGSRQAILIYKDADQVCVLENSASGQQDVDGTLEFEITLKAQISSTDLGDCWVGLHEDPGNSPPDDFVGFKLDVSEGVDQWYPYAAKNGGSPTVGDPITIANNTYARFKIIFKGATCEYYVNGVLEETIAVAADLPEDEQLFPTVWMEGGVQTNNIEARIYVKRAKFNFT